MTGRIVSSGADAVRVWNVAGEAATDRDALLTLSACVADTTPTDQLFPAQVGEFLRISGPDLDPALGVDVAIYSGGSGDLQRTHRSVPR